jgi:pyruvate,water dikinase
MGLEVSQIGGKAFNLGKLIMAGFNVPSRGFVLDVDVLDSWPSGREEVADFFVDYFGGQVVAVRSSAVAEDSGSASFAGQYKTTLHVRTREEFLRAVDDFVAGLLDDGIQAYQTVVKQKDSGRRQAALIVQEMVEAEIAGVLFTVNPLDGLDEMMITAASGIGEALVSGQVTGDTYVVDRDGMLKKMVIGGVKKDLRDGVGLMTNRDVAERILDDSLLMYLVKIGKRVEELFQCPQDIEWAIVGSQIFLLQARPITAMSTLGLQRQKVIDDLGNSFEKERARLEELGVVLATDCFSDQNIAELLTRHPTPMAFGAFCYIFADGEAGIRLGRNQMGYEIGSELDHGFFRLVGGQPRCSIVHDAFTYRIAGIPLSDYAILVRYYLEKIAEDSKMANYPEVVLYKQDPSLEFLTELFGAEKAQFYRVAFDRFFTGLAVLIEQTVLEMKTFEDDFRAYIAREKVKMESLDMNLQANIALCMEMFDHLRTVACVMFVKVARLGFFAYARLREKMALHYGKEKGEQLLATLTSGLDNDPSLHFNVCLAQYRDGQITFSELLERYGHLGANELEVSGLRYHEDSSLLERYAEQIAGDPRVELARRKAECDKVRATVATELGEEVASWVEVARQYLAGRELIKYLYLMEYDLVRQMLLRIEKILHWEDDLVFCLYPGEIPMLQYDSERIHRKAVARLQRRREQMNIYVPPVIFSDDLERIGQSPYQASDKILTGFGVTDQVVTGEVVKVADPRDRKQIAKLFAGCVLVTMTTDPSWAPLIAAIGSNGGLVTEIGGPLAHGAIVARELGIGAVLDVTGAMQILQDGMRVEVNGPLGVVKILD